MTTYTVQDIARAFGSMDIPYRVEHPGTLNASVVVGRTHFAPAVTETGQACDGIDSCDEHDQHDWHPHLPDAVARAMGKAVRARADTGSAQPSALGVVVLVLAAVLLGWTTAPGVGLAIVAAIGTGRLLFVVGRGVIDADRARTRR